MAGAGGKRQTSRTRREMARRWFGSFMGVTVGLTGGAASAIDAAYTVVSSTPPVSSHQVQPGETLSRIALLYGVSWQELARVNELENPNLIAVGRMILLGTRALGETAETVTTTLAPALSADSRALGTSVGLDDSALPPVAQQTNNAVLSANLPVLVEGRRFEAVPVTATVSEVLTVSPAALAQSLRPILSDAAFGALLGLGAEQRPVALIGQLGILVRLDPQTLSVAVDVPAERRQLERFSLLDLDQYPEAEQIYPSRFSAGVTTALSLTDVLDDDVDPTGQLGFFGFANFGGLGGLNLDYGGSFFFSEDDNEFRRDALVAFIDRPEQALRFSAGDLAPAQPLLAGATSILGLSVERSYVALQPSRIIRPTGRRSFLLDRPATVEIYANGQLINRFAAGPGPIDLADIPVANLTNNVTIVVEDALGRRELDSFSLANDLNLLDRGLDEFSFSVGVRRDDSVAGFNYSDDWLISGNYTRGLTEGLTVGGHAAVSEEFQNVGGAVAFATFGGVALFEAAVSRSAADQTGSAFGVGYRGGNFLPEEANDVLTVRADYATQAFATLADPFSQSDEQLAIAADYRFDVDEATSVFGAATYVDRYGAIAADRFLSLGATRRFGPLQASITARYGRDSLDREDTGVFLNVSRLFGARTLVNASYDSLSETTRFDIARSRRLQTPDFTYRLAWQDRQNDEQIAGQVAYFGSRFEADARVTGLLDSGAVDRGDQVGFRLQSGIGFSDGRFAVGRDPGRGFYMVRRHPSLGRARVELFQGRSQTFPLAQVDGFGPALAPVTTPYRATELTVAVRDAPVGYDTGNNRYVVLPGARSGVIIEVGGDDYRSRIATLLVEGQPLDLNYGELINVTTGERQSFFTNRSGRASFARLTPGDYEVRMTGRAFGTRFRVLNDDAPLIDMGVINLERVEP